MQDGKFLGIFVHQERQFSWIESSHQQSFASESKVTFCTNNQCIEMHQNAHLPSKNLKKFFATAQHCKLNPKPLLAQVIKLATLASS